ncbi:Uncharacterised protein [Mycobacterium tuberculosis]|nr:Uncharacterised protein [Mycobacterium tuberculosis]
MVFFSTNQADTRITNMSIDSLIINNSKDFQSSSHASVSFILTKLVNLLIFNF